MRTEIVTAFEKNYEYGWKAFTKEIVCEKLIKESAEKMEKDLIELLDARNPIKGYNVFTGGAKKGSAASNAGKKECVSR